MTTDQIDDLDQYQVDIIERAEPTEMADEIRSLNFHLRHAMKHAKECDC